MKEILPPYITIDGKKIYTNEKKNGNLYLFISKEVSLKKKNSIIKGFGKKICLDEILISNSILTNLSFLKNLKSINKISIHCKKSEIIKGLKYFPSLKILLMYDNKIKEISGLEKQKNLIHLRLDRNLITKISGLENLQSLKTLNLRKNKITSTKGLSNLESLEKVDLTQNLITDLSGMKNLPNLKELDLSYNKISQLKGLDKIPSLEILRLSHNKISDIGEITEFKNLPNLKELYLDNKIHFTVRFKSLYAQQMDQRLHGNRISKISGLDNLFGLEKLDISYNNITETSGLENLINLRELKIEHNYISKIKGLDNLTNLWYLHLSNNNLEDIRELKGLKNLHKLYSFNCENNPFYNQIRNLFRDLIELKDLLDFAQALDKFPSVDGSKYKYIDWDKIEFNPDKFYQKILSNKNFHDKLQNNEIDRDEFDEKTLHISVMECLHPDFNFYFRDFFNHNKYYSLQSFGKVNESFFNLTRSDLIKKLRNNNILSNYEKNHYIFIKNWREIEQIMDNWEDSNDNAAIRDFRNYILKKFSVKKETGMKILL